MTIPECAVRIIVNAISSTRESRALWMTSNVIGSIVLGSTVSESCYWREIGSCYPK